jgi:hypothetical protein
MHCQLPAVIRELLDEHIDDIKAYMVTCCEGARQGYNVKSFPWLSDFIVKYEVVRVANAERLKIIVKDLNLDLIVVPNKYLYHIDGQPLEVANGNYIVVVQKLQGVSGFNAGINVQQARQLYKVCKYTPYYDMVTNNYLILPDNRVAIIDTDELAMPDKETIQILQNHWHKHGDSARSPEGGTYTNPNIINSPFTRFSIAMDSKWDHFDDNAYSYLCKKIRKYERSRMVNITNSI